jgi:phosphoserine aminotransferase
MKQNLVKKKKYNVYNTPPHFNVHLLSDDCQYYVKTAEKYFLAMIL